MTGRSPRRLRPHCLHADGSWGWGGGIGPHWIQPCWCHPSLCAQGQPPLPSLSCCCLALTQASCPHPGRRWCPKEQLSGEPVSSRTRQKRSLLGKGHVCDRGVLSTMRQVSPRGTQELPCLGSSATWLQVASSDFPLPVTGLVSYLPNNHRCLHTLWALRPVTERPFMYAFHRRLLKPWCACGRSTEQ